MTVKKDISIEADLTSSVNNITNKVLLPPTKEASNALTKLISVITTIIDNATYKYIANSEYKKQKFLADLEKKYNEIPQQNIVEPDVIILGNSLESLKYALDKDYLVELYTNIIVSDMDIRTKNLVHISYIEVLKQLSKNDLEVLKAIYNVRGMKSLAFGKLSIEHSNGHLSDYEPQLSIYMAKIDNYIIKDYLFFSNSVENLQRLGLIEISYLKSYDDKKVYDELLENAKPYCQYILDDIRRKEADSYLSSENGVISISNLGYNLMKICLRDF